MHNRSSQEQAQEPVGFMRITEVLKVFPVSRSVWYAGIASGLYPKPVKLGKRTAAWRKSDIHELMEKCDRGEMK